MADTKGAAKNPEAAYTRTVSCAHLEGFQVLVRTPGQSWVVDEPPDAGGDGIAPNPFDTLLAALGSCTIVTVWHFATGAGVAIENLWVDLAIERRGKGAEQRFHITESIKVRGQLNEKDLQRIERYASRCPIHGLLKAGSDIETHVSLA